MIRNDAHYFVLHARLEYYCDPTVPKHADGTLVDGHSGLHIRAGDRMTRSGWTRREIDAVPGASTPADQQAALHAYWFPIWATLDAQQQAAQALREAERAQREADDYRQALAPVLERYGPPRAYWRKTWTDFDVPDPDRVAALALVQAWPYRTDGPDYLNLVLTGPTGTGKTLLAACALNDFVGDGGEFITFSALVRKLTQRGADVEELMQRYGAGQATDGGAHDSGCKVLVVDDFGVDWDHETGALMSELLDRRTANELLTIVTTNYKPAQLQEMLKARGWSRLMGRCMLVPVGGRDYRMEASA